MERSCSVVDSVIRWLRNIPVLNHATSGWKFWVSFAVKFCNRLILIHELRLNNFDAEYKQRSKIFIFGMWLYYLRFSLCLLLWIVYLRLFLFCFFTKNMRFRFAVTTLLLLIDPTAKTSPEMSPLCVL